MLILLVYYYSGTVTSKVNPKRDCSVVRKRGLESQFTLGY